MKNNYGISLIIEFVPKNCKNFSRISLELYVSDKKEDSPTAKRNKKISYWVEF